MNDRTGRLDQVDGFLSSSLERVQQALAARDAQTNLSLTAPQAGSGGVVDDPALTAYLPQAERPAHHEYGLSVPAPTPVHAGQALAESLSAALAARMQRGGGYDATAAKLAAQSMSGTSYREPPASEWDKVVDAAKSQPGAYWK